MKISERIKDIFFVSVLSIILVACICAVFYSYKALYMCT
jgi:hypothetical protein